jgi:hypothetical protein
MRRLSALCVVALVAGCGGGSTPAKKKPDAGNKDAVTTTDVGGTLDHVEDAPAAETAGDTAPDAGGTGADAPPDMGPTTGDASPETAGDTASADAKDGGVSDASDAGETAPRLVGFSFAGSVVTVARADGGVGLPLGFDGTVRTEAVTGSLSYDPTLVDMYLPLNRGVYQAVAPQSTFTLTVKGKTVTGSMRAKLEVEDGTTNDTFRFRDGPQAVDPVVRVMKLDGVDKPRLSLFIAISGGDGTMLTSEKLPDPFPAIDIKKIPHTFSLEDEGGTLLMQLDTLVPGMPGSGDGGADAGDGGAEAGDDAPVD